MSEAHCGLLYQGLAPTALTTYYDGVQPLTRVFDGFFVHSRGAMTLPLVAPGAGADLVGACNDLAACDVAARV